MTTRAYTTIEQSRKLAEILPLESADMCYSNDGTAIKIDANRYTVRYSMWKDCIVEIIPCWSLAALLDIIPDSIYDNTDEFSQLEFSKRSIAYFDSNDRIKIGSLKENLIDACYEMIIRLHELNLL